MINIISSDYSNFIIMMLIIIGMFIYSNKRWKKNEKIANRRLRFGTIFSSIIMALPCALILEPPFIVNNLQRVFGLSGRGMYITLAVITSIIFVIIIKFIYVPIDKDKH